MQKLQVELKNIPRNTSLVPCSISSGLNKEETLSDQSIVLACNNSEENQQKRRSGSNLRVLNTVYVLNKRSKPLMPTCSSKARRLVKSGKAVIVKRYPFTIKLTITTGETVQKVVLGEDTGYEYAGLSVISDKQELFVAEVKLRTNIVKLMSERKMYRVSRRGKHHWYRKIRFNNRRKYGDWLPPSIQHKVDTHVKLVKMVSKFLPITKIVIEGGKFDIQKIYNPEISGIEYQNGVQKGFDNVRAYVLCRDNYICQVCNKDNVPLHVHHIESRKTGGNRPDNLITLCLKCHKKYHEGKIKPNFKIKDNFRPETAMSIIRKRIIEELRKDFEVEETFGYITKRNRIELGIKKSHTNDAFVIAGGNNQTRNIPHIIEQKRRNNRCLQLNRKGLSPSIRRQRYPCQPKDLVKINNKIYEVAGTHSYGEYITIKNQKEKLNVPKKRISWIYHFGGLVYRGW